MLDAVEKIRKDYTLAGQASPPVNQNESSSKPSPDGDCVRPVQAGTTQSPPGNKPPVHGDADEPSDSLFTGIGKSIVRGATAFPRTFWGALATAEDVARNVPGALP